MHPKMHKRRLLRRLGGLLLGGCGAFFRSDCVQRCGDDDDGANRGLEIRNFRENEEADKCREDQPDIVHRRDGGGFALLEALDV